MSRNDLADTVPDLRALPTSPIPIRAPLGIDVSGRTTRGNVRPNNEDNFHIVQFGRYLRTTLSSLPGGVAPEEFDRSGYGFVVADGMGGHVAGEVASRRAITLLLEFALQTPDWILGQDETLLAKIMERTVGRFQSVNASVLAQAQADATLHGMGTTLSVAITINDDLIVAHVGDSPIFLFRGGKLQRLTRDHTVANTLGDLGIDVSRLRHVLTRAIGHAATGGEPDVSLHRLADGDRLLLCTDGLSDVVDAESIERELARGTPSEEACQALVDLALERGGRDNVTVVVATYRFPPLA